MLFPCAAWGITEQGTACPLNPSPGASPLDPFCVAEGFFSKHLSACGLRETERVPTGAMKMKKKAGQESELSCRFFLIFPGCTASGWRCSTAQPVGGSAAASSQSYHLYQRRGFCVWQCRSRLAKIQSSSANVCLRDALFHREMVWMIHIAISGIGCRVNDPAGGGGGKAPPRSPHATPGNCLFDTNCHFRRKGPGMISLVRRKGSGHCPGHLPPSNLFQGLRYTSMALAGHISWQQ